MAHQDRVVTRIAPSPTGNLHIGTARTALFNYLFARHYGGRFVLRFEDTDRERSRGEYEENILDGLSWLGLAWDEMARQSERGALYRERLEGLIASGAAYLSREPAKHDPSREVEVVRLKNPNTRITFVDEIRGEIAFDTQELGDLVIARSLDEALYHFSVVVDDAEMGITHVIRGEDHISNTPRQILIQEALGLTRPVYAHIPLILAPDRSKLSKRKGAVAIGEYRAEGYLAQALVNYLALLGWNPGDEREVMDLEALCASFSLEGVQKGGAIFDRGKLDWFNRAHLLLLPEAARLAYLAEALSGHPALVNVLTRSQAAQEDIFERLSTAGALREAAAAGEYAFYLEAPTLAEAPLVPVKEDDPARTPVLLERTRELLDTVGEGVWQKDAIKDAVWDYASETGRAQVLWPLRVALSGRERSPDPFTIAEAIGKQETLARIDAAIRTLRTQNQ